MLIPYSIIRWLIIISIFLSLLLSIVIEKPSIALRVLSQPLKEQGITYKSMRGGILSGFKLSGVNYQDKIKAKEVSLKVDWDKLENKVLYIENIKLDEVEVDKDYLKSLIDTNSSDENSSDSNSSLPFDKVVINNSDISIKKIIYDKYKINSAKLHINHFTTDMKKQYRGDVKLYLDSNVTKAKLDATIKDDFVKLNSNMEIEREFLKPYLADNNITLTTNPKFILKADGTIKKVNYNLVVNGLGVKQNSYSIKSKKLVLIGNYSQNQDINAKIDTILDGNMGSIKLKGDTHLNLKDLNNTLKFNMNADIRANREFVEPYLADNNITLNSNPQFAIKANGSMQKLNYTLITKQLGLKQNSYSVDSKKLLLRGNYSIIKQDINAKLDTKLDSNIAYLNFTGDTNLNLNDLNDTLEFNLKANLVPNREFVESQIPDKNLSIQRVAPVNIQANGSLKKTLFHIDYSGLEVQHNKLSLAVPSMQLKGDTNPLQGDTHLSVSTDIKSTAGDGHIDDKVSLNFNDINKTLDFNAKIKFLANNRYINRFLKKEKITITNRPKIDISLHGGLQKLTIQTHTQAHIKQNKIVSKLTLSTTPIEFYAQNHRTKGSIKLINSSKNMGFDIRSRFDGDYTDPKKIETTTEATIKKFNLFGVNLNPIAPLKLNIENSSLGVKAIIDSDRIKLHATTHDYDHIKFNIKTRNLYLYKMIELPDELHHKFIKLDLKGDTTISKHYGNIQGVIKSNKKFKAKVDIHNNKSGLNANISTQHLKLKANGNIEKKDIKAKIEINSLKELQKEMTKLYAFNKFDIDGSLKLNAKLNGEKIWANINSPKLKLNGFSIDGLDIDANYHNKLITLNKFNFKTTGFKDKKLNKEVYLNKKGKIYLGENKKIDIDMHPNILIKANGNDNKLDGKVTIKQLPLGHPDYGSMFLNCDIDYKKRGLDKSVTGNILMKKMKLFYEAKFLDIDYDPDVVIITKKDKRKKLKPKDDSFLNHTKVDISIKAPQARYKTPDIDILFDINLKADKQFRKDLALLGKIEDINGHFDQIPKRFEIEHSNVVFKGGKKINPILDIKVKYELPQVIIYINIGGYANRPKLEFTSQPPMPKKDIMSYLLLGVSTSSLSEGEGSLSREAELFILNQAARDFAYDLDLDKVFIKDDGTGEGYAIEAGKKIGKKNMVIIESSKQGNSFILEHDINRNIKVRVGQHQKEHPSQSVDIYFRKRFK